ncbi:Carbon-nitrogen hydrolase family protein, partial [hydrothermal vent metagenome]
MTNIRIAAAQFENINGDKKQNLAKIRELTKQAVAQGAEIVSFHECSISAYSFVQNLSKEELMELAEPVPAGESIQQLMEISSQFSVPILAGLIEREGDKLYNTYVCVDGHQLVAKFRKLHAFINPHVASGDEYCVFELRGWKCGILICYDNNIIENVRMTTLLGADIIFMPHVTGCLPSVMPGRGLVDTQLWEDREVNPVALRMELDGPKGRGWLMHWLPARAYDNGIYA